jgi:indole-3-glycerol phosphate synthase
MLAGPRHLPLWTPGGRVAEALRRGAGDELRWIARISPHLRSDENPGALLSSSAAERAVQAASMNAAAVWLSTDELFAGGSYAALASCRAALEAAFGERRPRIIAEDVVVDPVQLDRAAGAGADSVLLIVMAAAAGSLASLVDEARKRGLEPIVEVASAEELPRALATGAQVIAATALDRHTGRLDVARIRAVMGSLRGDNEVGDARRIRIVLSDGAADRSAEAADAAVTTEPPKAG